MESWAALGGNCNQENGRANVPMATQVHGQPVTVPTSPINLKAPPVKSLSSGPTGACSGNATLPFINFLHPERVQRLPFPSPLPPFSGSAFPSPLLMTRLRQEALLGQGPNG